jgi:hypothetical protein
MSFCVTFYINISKRAYISSGPLFHLAFNDYVLLVVWYMCIFTSLRGNVRQFVFDIRHSEDHAS